MNLTYALYRGAVGDTSTRVVLSGGLEYAPTAEDLAQGLWLQVTASDATGAATPLQRQIAQAPGTGATDVTDVTGVSGAYDDGLLTLDLKGVDPAAASIFVRIVESGVPAWDSDPFDLSDAYEVTLADLRAGPVNLVPPAVTGANEPGESITIAPGLWLSINGSISQSRQLLRGGVGGTEIAIGADYTYTLTLTDIQQGLTLVEQPSDRAGAATAEQVVFSEANTFAPTDIADLYAWFEFAPEHMFQMSNGTMAVTAADDPVGYVADLSGNGRHIVQATAGNRPLYKTDGAAHWIEFDGVNDRLRAAGLAPLDANINMTFVVMTRGPGTSGLQNVLSFTSTVNSGWMVGVGKSNQFIEITTRGENSANPAEVSPLVGYDDTDVFITRTIDNSRKGSVYVNKMTDPYDASGYGASMCNQFSISARDNAFPQRFYRGRVYFAAIYRRELTAQEIVDLRNYALGKAQA